MYVQNKGVEDNTSSKWHPEKSGNSSTYFRQNRYQDKQVTQDKDGHLQ